MRLPRSPSRRLTPDLAHWIPIPEDALQWLCQCCDQQAAFYYCTCSVPGQSMCSPYWPVLEDYYRPHLCPHCFLLLALGGELRAL